MSYRANGTRANGHRANGNRAECRSALVTMFMDFKVNYKKNLFQEIPGNFSRI